MKRIAYVVARSTLVALGITVPSLAAASELEFHLRLVGSVPAPLGGHRIVGEPNELIYQIWVTNNSSEAVLFPNDFHRRVAITVRINAVEVPIEIVRLRSPRLFDGRPFSYILHPRQTLEVTGTIRPSGGGRFQSGLYSVDVDATSGERLLTRQDGNKWAQRFPLRSTVPVLVRPAESQREWIYAESLKANVLMSAGDLEGAARIYESIRATAPDQRAGYLGLAKVELARGMFQSAVQLLEVAVAIGLPVESVTWDTLGYAYVGAGQEAKAAALLRERLSAEQASERLKLYRQRLEAQRRE